MMLRTQRLAGALAVLGALAGGAQAQETAPAPAAGVPEIRALENAVRTLTEENNRLRATAAQPTTPAPAADPQVTAELEAARADLARATSRVSEIEAALATTRGEVERLRRDLEAARAEARSSADAAAAERTRAEQATNEVTTLKQGLVTAERSQTELEQELFGAGERINRLRADLLAARNDLSAAEGQLQSKTKEAEALAAAGRDLVAERDALEAELAELREELTTATTVTPEPEPTRSAAPIEPAAGPPVARERLVEAVEQALGPDRPILVEDGGLILPAEFNFSPASAVLPPATRAKIVAIGRSLAAVTASQPSGQDWRLQVEGHTCRTRVGGKAFASNQALSEARARFVFDALAEGGMPTARLSPVGFAETRPLDPADTPEAYQRNRRVELRVIGG